MDEEKSLKYGIYARKSTESDERQALSIESLKKEMEEIAFKENLKIEKEYEEKHSAKESRSRPSFIKLISDLEKELINSILVWSPDRLSRNAGDLGDLVDLMDKGKLMEIRTYNQVFSNNPNHKFLLMILCSQAKLENDNRGINIKRGIRNKYSQGWLPRPAPIGYLNLKIGTEAKIITDPDKAPYIKQIFEKVGLEGMKVKDLRIWLINNTPLVSKKCKPLAKSVIYSILRNPFYYGKLPYKGELLEGKQPHIVEKELFDKAQANLRPLRKIDWNHRSKESIAGFIKCGECGDNVIEWCKRRKLKSGGYREHFYFRCSKFKNPNCKQPSVTYNQLIKQLADIVSNLDISEVKLSEDLQEKIMDYYLINTIANQNPTQTMLLLRSENQRFTEITQEVIKEYFRYVILCKETECKTKILKNLNLCFLLKDKIINIYSIQSH